METAFGGGHHALDGGEMRDQNFVGIEERCFEDAGAAQPPELFGQFLDQDFLGLIGRLMFGAEFGFERVHRFRDLVGKREFVGRQSVLRKIEPHTLGASHEQRAAELKNRA